MPLVLNKNPALLSLDPLAQEVQANEPPVVNAYDPGVEKWRKQIWDQMPQQLKARPDAATLLDKALYTMNGESSGNEGAVGDGGAAWGLYQSHHIPAGSDATTQINDMWRMVSNNPDQWTDWGEGALYNGQPFGALGRTPYPGDIGKTYSSAGGSVGNTALNTIPQQQQGMKPTINYISDNSSVDQADYIDKETGGFKGGVYGPFDINSAKGIRSGLSNVSDSLKPPYLRNNTLERMESPIDPSTGGPWDASFGPFDARQGQEFVDAPMVNGNPNLHDFGGGTTGRGNLEAGRQGKDKLGNAALAGATALPIIGAGPIAGPLGVVGGGVGQSIDESLGLPQVNVPVLGKVGPATLAGGALAGLAEGGGTGLADSTVRNPVIKPNLRVVQPNERPPGALNIVGKNNPDPKDFLEKARAMGMTDDEIRSSFPGAIEAASGIDTGVQQTARTNLEQTAKGAAAKRTYERVYKEHYDALIEQGYNPGEAESIATGLASRDARQAAAQAPENLPKQRENVPYSEETATEMQKAQERLRSGNQIVDESSPGATTSDALTAEADRLDQLQGSESPYDSVAKAARVARDLGDPFSTIRDLAKNQGRGTLNKAVDENQQEKRRYTPEEAAALRAERTVGTSSRRAGDSFTDAAALERKAAAEEERLNQRITERIQDNVDRRRVANELEANRQEWLRNRDNPEPAPPTDHGLNVLNEVSGVAGKFLSLKSSMSPPLLRQGLPRLLTNPKQALKEFGLSMKSGASEAAAREIDGISFEQPWISPVSVHGESPFKGFTWDELGGHRWDWGDAVDQADRVPGYEGRGVSKVVQKGGQVVGDVTGAATKKITGREIKLGTGEGISERQAAVQMNLNARGRFQETAQRMWDFEEAAGLPHDKAMYQDLVRQIENSMQYGRVTQGKVPLLFSTQALSGRIKAALDSTVGILRNPAGVMRPGATQEAAKNLVAFMGLNYTLAQLASQIPGVEVNYNPLPSIRIGQHHYDMWGGIKPIATFAGDIGQIFYKTAETGDIDKGLSDALLRGKDFLRAGTSPLTNVLISAAERKDFIGQPYSLTDNIKSGELFKDLGLNFVAESLWDAFKADGLKGSIMDLVPAALSGGVSTYDSPKDRRNDISQEQFGKPFDDLTPLQRQQVEQHPDVQQSIKDQPSDYRTRKDAALAPVIQQEQQAEQAFKDGKLSKPLPEIWQETGIQRRQIANDLKGEFADMFAGFDPTRYDTAVTSYFDLANKPENKNPDGTPDWDKIELAQQDYLKTLKPDEQQWMNEALQVNALNKSPLHQKYLQYIDDRKAKGYFNIALDDPFRNEKLAKLDMQNPQIDVANWYFKGGVDGRQSPVLNSAKAVDMALQVAPNRPIQFSALSRPINQNPGSIEAWKQYGQRLENYFNNSVPYYKDQVAKDLFGDDPNFHGYDRLDRANQNRVNSRILTLVRDGSPELEAALQFFGHTKDGNGDYAVSQEALPYLQAMLRKYGEAPVRPQSQYQPASRFIPRRE